MMYSSAYIPAHENFGISNLESEKFTLPSLDIVVANLMYLVWVLLVLLGLSVTQFKSALMTQATTTFRTS